MDLVGLAALLLGFGALGGLVNALTEQEGLLLPRPERLSNGSTVLRAGFVGNIVLGALAALILAVLYSPLGSVTIGDGSAPKLTLSLQALGGAFLSGVGGARVITAEVNKRLEKASKDELADSINVLAKTVKDLQAARGEQPPQQKS